MMRTTFDVPNEILQIIKGLARNTKKSYSAIANDLILKGLEALKSTPENNQGTKNGLLLLRDRRLGVKITLDDIKKLEEDFIL